ncbi:MAG: hypothetical protein CM1200mP3_06830 [Chloroflexota bacterium]|nr:MAG: hypothetical protein CM1200mP3_06830 [Chloroflexota bacterium]
MVSIDAVTRPMPYLGENSKSLTDAEKDHLNQRLDWEQKEGPMAICIELSLKPVLWAE